MRATALSAAGDWLRAHQSVIRAGQWAVVAIYALLLAVPAVLPLPDRTAHLWNNLTALAQFAFWGIWWPFVLLSMVLVGRSWCGLFCPEGALSEFASRHGRGRAVPRWITWRGWPFAAFVCTTVYGQMISVYQYPKPALLILGGSTAAAMAVGWLYGRDKRVWCRYLCPVSGVFSLLARLAPLHYRVDEEAWRASQERRDAVPRINCAPLVPIRTMKGASQCHMCGRCSGFRGAIRLAPRSPEDEVVKLGAIRATPWDSALILFGLMGVAVGAFHWSASPWFVAAKQMAAERLVDLGVLWPLEQAAPWWILTDYPQQNDVMTVLDGAVMLAYMGGTALGMALILGAAAGLANLALGRWSGRRFHHLVQALIPVAGCGVFLGLSALTVTMLKAEGLPTGWVAPLRVLLLAGAVAWSMRLAWRICGRYVTGLRRVAAAAALSLAAGWGTAPWVLLFWGW